MAASDGTGMDGAPSGWQVLAPLIDLVTPMAVRVAATLRLADLIHDAPVAVEAIADESGTDPDALARLLRHLTSHGIFAEPRPREFAMTDLAMLLRSDHPSGMQVSLDLGGFGGQMDLAFIELLHTVRTGQPAWDRVFGAPFWEFLANNPAMSASFDAAMSAGAEYVADDVASYDWSNSHHVVDVGGGTGTLITNLLHADPHLRATLVDLPETVERARVHLAAQNLNDRVEFVGQSFFDPLPTDGDVYVLNSILHDWPDREATTILRRCARAAAETGRVVIIEEHGDSGQAQAEMDLRMLVLCGGQERTLDEYTTLVGEADLTVTDVRTTPLGQISIECTRLPRPTGAPSTPRNG